MDTYISKVEEFHNTFLVPSETEPTIPSKERADLRVSLITEELKELQDAINNNDLVEVLDALCDLQYVLSGTILEFGMQNIFEQSFNEVHRSNMTKSCSSENEAKETCEHYRKEYGYITKFDKVQNSDNFIVFRENDNKVLKSINYSPANLEQFINK